MDLLQNSAKRGNGWPCGHRSDKSFSGGAILGDRIFMSDHATDEGVCKCGVGTRGHLGRLSVSIMDLLIVNKTDKDGAERSMNTEIFVMVSGKLPVFGIDVCTWSMVW